eukprot:CAMPEP_0174260044 /NCGR_PEP_ID=MMETSP0439-20130205/8791_1 /TAXON_ID=0 /ORGANISM="Stereomyxa ramosa, Strain Chinc5" /LENGTH=914 /DNA_ID=CAMNT_0015344173 /DNA_START=112 /DNA_END=2856 /DNA_ORIENTATION=+
MSCHPRNNHSDGSVSYASTKRKSVWEKSVFEKNLRRVLSFKQFSASRDLIEIPEEEEEEEEYQSEEEKVIQLQKSSSFPANIVKEAIKENTGFGVTTKPQLRKNKRKSDSHVAAYIGHFKRTSDIEKAASKREHFSSENLTSDLFTQSNSELRLAQRKGSKTSMSLEQLAEIHSGEVLSSPRRKSKLKKKPSSNNHKRVRSINQLVKKEKTRPKEFKDGEARAERKKQKEKGNSELSYSSDGNSEKLSSSEDIKKSGSDDEITSGLNIHCEAEASLVVTASLTTKSHPNSPTHSKDFDVEGLDVHSRSSSGGYKTKKRHKSSNSEGGGERSTNGKKDKKRSSSFHNRSKKNSPEQKEGGGTGGRRRSQSEAMSFHFFDITNRPRPSDEDFPVAHVAVQDHVGTKPDDLSFVVGDIIVVTKKNPDWWMGNCQGKKGVFPPDYVQKVEESDDSDDDGELVYGEVEDEGVKGATSNLIVSGSVKKLVEMTASPTIPEPHYCDAFLLSHTYYASSRRLFRLLKELYVKPQQAASEEEQEQHRLITQGRVINVFQKWVDNNFIDFIREPILVKHLLEFVIDNCPNNLYAIKLLKALLKQKHAARLVLPHKETEEWVEDTLKEILGEENQLTHRKTLAAVALSSPASRKYKGKKRKKPHRGFSFKGDEEDKEATSITFLDVSPLELAEQLANIEQRLFLKIQPVELLFASWIGKNRKELAPNVVEIIEWFNKISSWVASEIVLATNFRKRRAILSHFIETANECRKLRNYNALKEIMSALTRACITRLKVTWRGIQKTELTLFEELKELMDHHNNSFVYRQEFKSTEPPHLPFIGVHLSDLNFLEELPTRLEENNHINFKKMRSIERAARPIIKFKSFPYSIPTNNLLIKYLTEDIIALSESELFDASRACEPSQNKKGK